MSTSLIVAFHDFHDVPNARWYTSRKALAHVLNKSKSRESTSWSTKSLCGENKEREDHIQAGRSKFRLSGWNLMSSGNMNKFENTDQLPHGVALEQQNRRQH